MQFTSLQRFDDMIEREFTLGEIRGVLWTPAQASASHPVPLILAGQPGGAASLEQMRPRLFPRAEAIAQTGFATATIELPGAGGRPTPEGVAEARIELRAALSSGQPVPDGVVDRLVLPLVDQAVPEWQEALDALLEVPELAGPVGFSGGVVSIAVQLAAVDTRIAAAVLFAGSYVPELIMRHARKITIPLYMLLQWDDEGNDRQVALDLFDALGSTEKTLNANLGGHTGVPQHAGEDANRFFVRHLLARSHGTGGEHFDQHGNVSRKP